MKKILIQNDSYELSARPTSSGKLDFETNTKADNTLWNTGRIALSYEDVKAMMQYFEEVQADEKADI